MALQHTEIAPDAPAASKATGWRPGLDGLRAIAVLGVMAYHEPNLALAGGFLGVDLFFVLSGFLITGLLLDEHRRSGKVSLRSFWNRRGRRLLPALAALLRPSVQPYLISWLPLDPAALIAAYDGPVFIGQGTTDLQVSVTDAQALAAADPRATLKLWDGVNHVLKTAPAGRAANMATYADPALPLAPGVAADVGAFIRANGRR